MFSSLPSASKLYSSGAAKSKQKGLPSNARKRRRKAKTAVQNLDFEKPPDTTTLIEEASKTESVCGKPDYESDATESVNEVPDLLADERPTYEGDFHKPADVDENVTNDLVVDDNDNESPKGNVVVTSAEVHRESDDGDDVAVSDDQVYANDFEECVELSDEEVLGRKVLPETPVIVISSSDTPRGSLAGIDGETEVPVGDEISNTLSPIDDEISKTLSPAGDEEILPDSIPLPETCTAHPEAHEVDECDPEYLCGLPDQLGLSEDEEVAAVNVEEVVEPLLENDENDRSVSKDCEVVDPDRSNLPPDHLPSEDLVDKAPDHADEPVVDETSKDCDDNASIHSDCCSSKNIYNEYSTESVDENEDIFMVDDSKQSSNWDSTLSRSESDENPVLFSQESSEVSATESSAGDIHNPPESESRKVNVSHQAVNVPEYRFTVDVGVQKSLDDMCGQTDIGSSCTSLRSRRSSRQRMVLKRTTSLPNSLDQVATVLRHTGSSLYRSKHTKKLACNSSIQQIQKKHKNPREDDKSLTSRATSKDSSDSCIRSCESSITELSQASSCMLGVLPPVTVREARLRSYVVGSVRAIGSLLGAEELARYFPDKKVKVFVGTWNMNEQNPPKRLDDFLLPLGVSYLPDIYAVGIQEAGQSRSEWEILMQTTLGPSHVLLKSSSLGLLHLAVFIRRDLIWFCSEPEEDHITTRPGKMVKTKGAVAVSFLFFGTSFLFINSHLTAHERKLKERLADYEKICSTLSLPNNFHLKPQYQSKDVTSRFDNVFWCGDLNFRLVKDRPAVVNFVEDKLKKVNSCEFLLEHDQLHKAMNEGIAFHGFEEGEINFAPSYKFDIGTSFFSSTKQRVPSYTDRVLYRCKKKGSVTCIHYNVVPNIFTSDHKPVYAVFDVDIRAGRDKPGSSVLIHVADAEQKCRWKKVKEPSVPKSVKLVDWLEACQEVSKVPFSFQSSLLQFANMPLAAGMFSRDVYLEANRRRATALEVSHTQKNSTVCTVM